MPDLTIIISTLNERILNIEKAISLIHPQINYLIIHQNKKAIKTPEFLKREDIRIINTLSKGLSKSRNIGLKNCKTEYAIIGDDDVEYIEDGIIKILDIIKTSAPDFAISCQRSQPSPEGSRRTTFTPPHSGTVMIL